MEILNGKSVEEVRSESQAKEAAAEILHELEEEAKEEDKLALDLEKEKQEAIVSNENIEIKDSDEE